MSTSHDPRGGLIRTAKLFYAQGWMVGTSGNLSARLPDGSFWITASGRPKGALVESDLLRLDGAGGVLERADASLRASAETSIHEAVYALFPSARCCFHVHSVEANVVSRFTDGDELLLPTIEMMKGLGFSGPHAPTIAVFPNHDVVAQISDDVRRAFAAKPPALPAFLIRDHGLTVWASDETTGIHHVELLTYIFRYMVNARAAGLR